MKPDRQPVIATPSSPLEILKHKCLAALYQGMLPRILRCYHTALEMARSKDFSRTLSETDEKHLRQIQVAVQKFLVTSDPAEHKAILPLPVREIYLELQTLLRNRARTHLPWHLHYQAWEESLDLAPWQMDTLLTTAVTFQLTSGCSNFCRRCNEWALPRIRGHFSREAASKLLHQLLEKENGDLALYGGSDPLDWEDQGYSLTDLLAETGRPSRFSLLTKVPRGREARLKQLVGQGVDLAVSLTNRNRQRLLALDNELERPLTKQHATPDLLIPACLDEDFTTVKPSITDSYGCEISPDGAYIIIPTFTSALYPFGHKKIPVSRETPWFPAKKIGRPALLQDYFKPLQVITPNTLGLQANQIEDSDHETAPVFLEYLLDVQVENILLDNGEWDLTPPGMRSVKEYFDVFQDEARLKRKAMTLSVMRRLKKESLGQTPYARLSDRDKTAYRSKIHAHLSFTRKSDVGRARACAAAFFLAAIASWVRANPVKREIIAHLTRNEYQHTDRLPQLEGVSLYDFFRQANQDEGGQDPWEVFRCLSLCLVNQTPVPAADAFIRSCPTAYDPARDLFIKAPHCS